jgi:hypothetical protein
MYLKLFLMARDVERMRGEGAEGYPFPQVERTMQGLRAARDRACHQKNVTHETRFSHLLHQYAANHAYERTMQRVFTDESNARVRTEMAAQAVARKGNAR